jgi:hypothetical protein
MSRENPYTQRAIQRAIKAALSAGLRVVGVRPDGTVLTEARDSYPVVPVNPLTGQPKLRDAREKLGVH